MHPSCDSAPSLVENQAYVFLTWEGSIWIFKVCEVPPLGAKDVSDLALLTYATESGRVMFSLEEASQLEGALE